MAGDTLKALDSKSSNKLIDLIEQKCSLGTEQLQALIAELPKTARKRTLSAAREQGDASRLVAAVVCVFECKELSPVVLVCCDASEDFFAILIDNANPAEIKKTIVPAKTVLDIREQIVSELSIGADQQRTCACVRLADAECVGIVGGGPLYVASAARVEKNAESMSLEVKGRVIRALIPGLEALVDERMGKGASAKIGRVKTMFERLGRGQIFEEDSVDNGKIYAPSFIEGLTPTTPFQDPAVHPWTKALNENWEVIRDELLRSESESLWDQAWNQGATEFYAQKNDEGKAWRVAGVFMADEWCDDKKWPKTRAVLEKLDTTRVFEAFFARMPPRSKLLAHSDNINFHLTMHLGLQLEHGACAFRVGNQEGMWKEGEVLVANTSYLHSCRNDSDKSRFVLVLRFWHPDLSDEELLALRLGNSILARATGAQANSQEAKPKAFQQSDHVKPAGY